MQTQARKRRQKLQGQGESKSEECEHKEQRCMASRLRGTEEEPMHVKTSDKEESFALHYVYNRQHHQKYKTTKCNFWVHLQT